MAEAQSDIRADIPADIRADIPADIPARILRLFPHEDPAFAGRIEHREFLILRLMEDGDGHDLRWLCRQAERHELTAAFQRGGGRHLSRRNRRFWTALLNCSTEPVPPPAGAELWPLA